MIIAGVIAEYNPFHNGHLYHIEQTRLKSGADKVICVMSGSFVQRGEPAFTDKFARTRAALSGGADMVLELPAVYSLQAAEYFALGGVRILNELGVCDILSFGREGEELPQMREDRADRLDKGYSYPSSAYLRSKPNDLLAAEYLKALQKINSPIKPFWVKRTGAHDGELPSQSALGIRQEIRKGIWESPSLGQGGFPLEQICAEMPQKSFEILKDRLTRGEAPWQEDILFRLISAKVRCTPVEQLNNILGADEGLEYRLKSAADQALSLEQLISLTKSKRYTRARICRYLMCTLLDITKEQAQRANSQVPYIRCLGVREQSKELLSLCAQKASVPFFTSGALLKKGEFELFNTEMRATDMYSLLSPTPQRGGRDMTEGLIVV